MSVPRRVLLATSNDIAALTEETIANAADFFPTEVQRTSEALDNRPVKHIIQISLPLGGVIVLVWNKGSSTDIARALNSAVALVADSLYTFEYVVPPGETYNVQQLAGANRDITCDIFETDDLEFN